MPVYARVDPVRRTFVVIEATLGALGASTLEEFSVADWPPPLHTISHARAILAARGWPTRAGVFVEADGHLLFDLQEPAPVPDRPTPPGAPDPRHPGDATGPPSRRRGPDQG